MLFNLFTPKSYDLQQLYRDRKQIYQTVLRYRLGDPENTRLCKELDKLDKKINKLEKKLVKS